MILIKNKLFIIICLLYLVSRSLNLTIIPVFGDEAIYIRWSQIIKNVDTLRFIPLTDGKQPLYMWLTAINLKFFEDPLVAGRVISIISGLGTITFLYLIGQMFFTTTIAIMSTFVYLIMPYTFFFDRLGLPDNLLSMLGVGSLFFSLLLSKHRRFDISMILGLILGIAWITKSPAIYFIILSLATYYIYNPHFSLRTDTFLPLISVFISFVIYNLLRLGPQFQQLALRNRDYVFSVWEIIKHPFDPLIPHLFDTYHIYNFYLSWIFLPVLVFFLISYFFKNKLSKPVLVIILWWILPQVANSVFAKVFTSRYILFTIPPLIILFSYFISQIKAKYYVFIMMILSLFTLPRLYKLTTHPFQIQLPSTDTGYLQGWTSGWGIKDAAKYLKERSLLSNVIVGTEGYFGTLPDGLQIYTDSQPRLTVFGVGIDLTSIPEKLVDARNHQDEVYILINKSRQQFTPLELSKMDLVFSYPKPNNDQLELFRLK